MTQPLSFFTLFALAVILAQRRGLFGREVIGYRLGYLTGSCPFGTTEQERLETGALHGRILLQGSAGMTQHDVRDAGLAIVHRKDKRFFASRSSGGGVCHARVEQMLDVGRTTHGVVHLVLSMHPVGRKSLGDGVFAVAPVHHVFALLAMRTSVSRSVVQHQFSVLKVAIRARFLVPAFPSAQGNDAVELLPSGKGIVRCMIDDESATVLHIVQESLVGVLRPSVAIVVQHYHVVILKPGLEAVHVATGSRGECDVRYKEARVVQYLLDSQMAHLPVVVVLSGHDECLDGGRLIASAQCDEEDHGQKSHDFADVFHTV